MTDYNGFLVVNKRKGIGSTDYVRMVKKIFNQKKVGHSGTLDLLASGVLVVCLGRATKTIEYLQKEKKTYIASIIFGKATDTLDAEGKVTESTDEKVSIDDLNMILNDFVGEITQIPPMYSALKYKGQRLYDLARQGISIERKERQTTIYSIELLDFSFENQEAKIKTQVSAGTYIRTLVDDIGRALGNYAYMSDLGRVHCSGFSIDQAVDLINEDEDFIRSRIIDIVDIHLDIEKITLSDEALIQRLKNGMTEPLKSQYKNGTYLIYEQNKILGIANIFTTAKGTMLKLAKHLYV